MRPFILGAGCEFVPMKDNGDIAPTPIKKCSNPGYFYTISSAGNWYGTNATAHPTAEWIAQQITEAFPWDEAPSYLIRDRDPSYGTMFKRRLDALESEAIRPRPGLLARTDTSAGDRFDPPRVLGSNHNLWRGAPTPDADFVCPLLQSGADASIAGQRFAHSPPGPASWPDHRDSPMRRIAPPVRPDDLNGRDRPEHRD